MHRDRGSLSGSRYRTRYGVEACSPDRVRDSGWQALPIQLVSWKYRETRVALGAVPTDPCLSNTWGKISWYGALERLRTP